MDRVIIIPEDVKEKLQRLTDLENETQIALIYQQRGNKCQVVDFTLLGANQSNVSTHADPEHVEVLKIFLRSFPEYKFIPAHTHPKSIVNSPNSALNSFSSGDYNTFNNASRIDPNFMMVLITPYGIKIHGHDNPKIEFCLPLSQTIHEHIYGTLKKIRDRLGYSQREITLGKFHEPNRRKPKPPQKPK